MGVIVVARSECRAATIETAMVEKSMKLEAWNLISDKSSIWSQYYKILGTIHDGDFSTEFLANSNLSPFPLSAPFPRFVHRIEPILNHPTISTQIDFLTSPKYI